MEFLENTNMITTAITAGLFFLSSLFYYVGFKLRKKIANNDIISAVIESHMIQAENLFESGTDKKKWVVDKVHNWCKEKNLPISRELIDGTIESFMSIANSVNRRNESKQKLDLFDTTLEQKEKEIARLKDINSQLLKQNGTEV